MIFFGSVESVDGGLVTRVLCVTSCVCIYVVRCMHSFLRRCWWFIVVQLSTYVLRKHRLLKVVVYACLYILHTNESENWKRFDDEQCSQRIGNDLTTNTKLWCMPVCIYCTQASWIVRSENWKRFDDEQCSQRIGNDLTTNTKLWCMPVCICCTENAQGSQELKRVTQNWCSQRIGNDLTTNTKLWCIPVCICCTQNAQGSQELKRVRQKLVCGQRIGNDLTTNTKLLWIPVCIHCTKVTIVQSIAQRERCSGLGQCVYVQPVLANNMCWFWCPCEEQWHKR